MVLEILCFFMFLFEFHPIWEHGCFPARLGKVASVPFFFWEHFTIILRAFNVFMVCGMPILWRRKLMPTEKPPLEVAFYASLVNRELTTESGFDFKAFTRLCLRTSVPITS